MQISQKDLESAFQEYQRVKDACSSNGDWSAYAELFAGDGCFVDHHGMGRFEGPEGIRTYITKAMQPYPNMTFPIDWTAFDLKNNAVVFQVQNAFPAPPVQPNTGLPFSFPNWTRVVYNPILKKWTSEETVYNPARDAQRTVKDWVKAGGKFQSKEMLKYKFAHYPTNSNDGTSKL